MDQSSLFPAVGCVLCAEPRRLRASTLDDVQSGSAICDLRFVIREAWHGLLACLVDRSRAERTRIAHSRSLSRRDERAQPGVSRPGKYILRWSALKGPQTCGIRGPPKSSATVFADSFRLCRFLPPLQGGSPNKSKFPGLKPRTRVYCPIRDSEPAKSNLKPIPASANCSPTNQIKTPKFVHP
jgi:hypothetical protein